MPYRHGGDIYQNRVKTDFSINTNPLGAPQSVKAALSEALNYCGVYPDIDSRALTTALARMLGVPEAYIILGNGASELFMALVHALRPKKILIPVPSFYGYEYAAEAVEAEIIYYEAKAENSFALGEDFLNELNEDIDLLFIANPNNPNGALMSGEYLTALLRRCRDKNIYAALDECFIEFCENAPSMLGETEQFKNLLLIRAFTKIFAIPAVRLGYLVCSDGRLAAKLKKQLPEWNISSFAQAAGCACALEKEYIGRTQVYITKERTFLEKGLKELGIKVFPSGANFLLIYSECPLYELLLERGILIRDCANIRGLSEGFYRIAVKSREENEILLSELRACLRRK